MAEILKHTVGGREYELHTRQTEQGWEVIILHDGRQIGPAYRASIPEGQQIGNYNAQSVIDGLVKIAKGDLDAWKSKCW
jgi:hypothetical protein